MRECTVNKVEKETSGLKNNKRIAKNTGMLYIRMLFTMIISLYTSRVMLNILGVEDFGIYNLIGGVIVLFSFIQISMTTAVQRFLTFELGKNNIVQVNIVFNTSLIVYVAICFVVLFFAETVGLWFVKTQLNIPPNRTTVVVWVYQFSVFAALIQILQMPYNASIIAYEKMSFYAIFSFVESALKLLIIYVLLLTPDFDNLKVYSVLVLIVSFISFLSYRFFCIKYISTCRFKRVFDKGLFYKILNFSGWSIFGSLAVIGLNQGIGIIMNLFYGVLTNAALGIANQVGSAVNRFIGSFQTAFNPQIVKSYAQDDFNYLNTLVSRTSKYSYFLMLLLSIPLLMEMEYILNLWLGQVPFYAISFCQFTLIYILIDSMSGPFYMVIYASGRIRNYQIVISTLILISILIAYVLLKYKFDPSVAILIRVFVSFIFAMYRVLIVNKLIGFPLRLFYLNILPRILLITILSLLICYFIQFNMERGLERFIIISFTSIIVSALLIFFLGLDIQERKVIWNYIFRIKDSLMK